MQASVTQAVIGSGLGSATDLATALLPNAGLSAAVGLFSVGALAWAAGPRRKLEGRLIRTILVVLNPVVALAALTAPATLFLLAAALLIFDGIARLRAQPGDSATVGLGLRLVGAAMLSNGALALYPLLLASTPALAPWRGDSRKITGFICVLWTPLAMLAVGAAYLGWIWGWPDLSATPGAIRRALGGATLDAAGLRSGAMALSLLGIAAVATSRPSRGQGHQFARKSGRLEGGALWLIWILGAILAWLLVTVDGLTL